MLFVIFASTRQVVFHVCVTFLSGDIAPFQFNFYVYIHSYKVGLATSSNSYRYDYMDDTYRTGRLRFLFYWSLLQLVSSIKFGTISTINLVYYWSYSEDEKKKVASFEHLCFSCSSIKCLLRKMYIAFKFLQAQIYVRGLTRSQVNFWVYSASRYSYSFFFNFFWKLLDLIHIFCNQ